jgi:hypothetical protein
MKRKEISQSASQGGAVIQFNLFGLIVFSISLVLVAGWMAYGLGHSHSETAPSARPVAAATGTNEDSDIPPAEMPPWGEMHFADIELEPPEEYLAFDLNKTWRPAWVFELMNSNQVWSLMFSCGVPPARINQAFALPDTTITVSNVVINPDDDLMFSLSPDTRAKLYGELARSAANSQFIRFPFCFPGRSFDASFADSGVKPAIVELTRKLLYVHGDVQCFSDYELMLRHIASEDDRLTWVKALSRQSAVLPRLRIRPDTDIDKIIGYWSHGVAMKDLRPLLESLKRHPGGGSLSVLYVLPPFARQRLYTFPLPSKEGDPVMDCHWSTLNFFNETPDDRYNNPAVINQFLSVDCYEVARPNIYGDIIVFLDAHRVAVHSALYLADDIVFTKNGNNFAQPWMLMRLKDLQAKYAITGAQMVVFRRRNF